MGIEKTFDNSSEEILKPEYMIKKIPNFPKIVIIFFSYRTLESFFKNYNTVIIDTITAGYKVPIYKMNYKSCDIAFYLSPIGAPATIGLLEEVIAKGADKILFFGSAGSLCSELTQGHIIVPTEAYRDEGTSYHYASAENDFIKVKTADRLFSIISSLHIPVIVGKTWTTDAIYRETRKNMELRKKAGCIVVEMECAAIMALAAFRNKDIYQFLYVADNLDCEKWDARILSNTPSDICDKLVLIALEVAIKL